MAADDAGGYWLDQKNPEFDQIKFYLKTCLQNNGECENVEVWKIDNLEANFGYERKTSNMLKVACWMNTNGMEGGYSLEDICTRGLRFDRTEHGGLEFTTGVIDFESKLALYTSYCFLYYEVAVGKALVCDGQLHSQKLPAGYDSFYVPASPLDKNQDGEFDLSEYRAAANFDGRAATQYRHRYFVGDAAQVSAKYVVRFDLAKKRDYEPPAPQGEDAQVEVTHFDPVALTGVVLRPGTGVGGVNLIPIGAAYEQALEGCADKGNDPVVQSKQDWTGRQLTQLEEKTREVNLNYAEMVGAIEEAAAAAKRRLQTVTRGKLETLLSMEVELRREVEQMGWLDAHIDLEMQRVQAALNNPRVPLSPSEKQRCRLAFLKSWKTYTMFRNSASRAKPSEMQALAGLHGDTKVRADIQIFADPYYANSSSSFPAALAPTDEDARQAPAQYIYAAPLQPTELLVSAAMQRMMGGEMEALQGAIRAAVEAGGPPLPGSVERPLLGTQRVQSLALHALLDEIALEEPVALGPRVLADEERMELGNDMGEGSPPLPSDDAVLDVRGVFAAALADETGMSPLAAPRMSGRDDYGSAFGNRDVGEVGAGHGEVGSRARPGRGGSFAASVASSAETGVSPAPPSVSSAKLSVQRNSTSAAAALFGGSDQAKAPPQMPRQSLLLSASAARVAGASGAYEQSRRPPPPIPPPMPAVGEEPAAVVELPEASIQGGRGPMGFSALVASSGEERWQANKHITMDLGQLLPCVKDKPLFSLMEIGARKRKQFQARQGQGQERSIAQLQGSAVLTEQQAQDVYYSLPFFAKPPRCSLLYSTTKDYRSLEELYSKTAKHRGPSLLLLKTGDFSFGAYLTHQLAPTLSWTGSPSCFLFSASLGVKLPYHARTAGELGAGTQTPASTPLAFYADPDSLFFGNGDLSLDGGLQNGSSEVENCYGCGLNPRSPEALCLLGGTPMFTIDTVEVWAVVM